mmetsp:Transcript_22688/g.53712  ORF Transcript_22688/g.53712 Transcript_22688/m.53712 type:complete len:673 (-) Transcript_22688:1562-3580(-)|eukprot:CAMPEP_0113506562 /NCGR_PEP_ID=MMETSP0014_2-20120614/35975_1 /TAXON_ID=2857 /ORGANISM="Nitzschia sp." /LENGTH=672 /DNA_ID=CAMNT_0000402067 /DNA_START=199 /DNA_END=2217 /DNA_ORIENTATION=+ /assembly_acc=CAM_ASM_000159
MGISDYQRRKSREIFNIRNHNTNTKKRRHSSAGEASNLGSSGSSGGGAGGDNNRRKNNKRRRFSTFVRFPGLSSTPLRLTSSSSSSSQRRRISSSSLSPAVQNQRRRLQLLMMGKTTPATTTTTTAPATSSKMDGTVDDIAADAATTEGSESDLLNLHPKTVMKVKMCVSKTIRGGEHNVMNIVREVENDMNSIDAYANQFASSGGSRGGASGNNNIGRFLPPSMFGRKKREEEHLTARRYEWTNTFRQLCNTPDIRDVKTTRWSEVRPILERVVVFPTKVEEAEAEEIEQEEEEDVVGLELAKSAGAADSLILENDDDDGEASESLKTKYSKKLEATLAQLSISSDFSSANNKWRKVEEAARSISLQNVDDESLQRQASIKQMDLQFDVRLDTQDKKDQAFRESSVVKEIEERQKAKEAEKRAKSLMRPLSDEELERIEDVVHGSLTYNSVVAQDGSDSVQQSSMHTLQPGQWVGDEVIHYFYLMLSKRDKEMCEKDPSRKPSHFFKSFFMTKLLNEGHATKDGQYEYSNVKRWSKKVPGKDLFGLNKILFPINMGNAHWIAACIFMEKKRIEIFDSMGGSGRVYLDALFQYIKDEHKAKKGSPLPDEDQWELVPTQRDTPRQRNGYDCGVFTCMFADFVSKDCPLIFNQDHINQCRHRIALSILNGKAIM